MSHPGFHWDSFFLGAALTTFIQIAFEDYMPSPLVQFDSQTKLILGLAGFGCSLLFFLHMLHKPRIISPDESNDD